MQQAFLYWLRERRPPLPINIIVGDQTAEKVEFTFAGWPELECWVTESGLDIAAMKDGGCWDLLVSLDVVPVAHSHEWGCEICDKEGRSTRFQSRDALWRDHLFEPLEQWIMGKLAGATRIEFHQLAGKGATWANLV